MTRKDEIRKYCSDNGFPLGACSSIASLQAITAVEAVKWADETMLDKACKWLKENINKYSYVMEVEDTKYMKVHFTDSLIEDFRKAMGE